MDEEWFNETNHFSNTRRSNPYFYRKDDIERFRYVSARFFRQPEKEIIVLITLIGNSFWSCRFFCACYRVYAADERLWSFSPQCQISRIQPAFAGFKFTINCAVFVPPAIQ